MRFCTECGTSLDHEASKQLFCFNCGAQLSSDHDNIAPKLPPMPPAAPPVKKEGPVLPRIPQMPPIPGQQIGRDTSKEIDSNEVESKDLSNKRPDTFQNGFDSYGIILTDTRKIAKKCRSTSNDIFNIIKDYTHRLSKYGHQYIIFDYDASRYQNQSWENCVDELSKFYYNQSITPEYLFIIGGDDIIPMPVFDNLSGVEAGDNDYESDVPYSYLETYDVETSIWDGTLYQ